MAASWHSKNTRDGSNDFFLSMGQIVSLQSIVPISNRKGGWIAARQCQRCSEVQRHREEKFFRGKSGGTGMRGGRDVRCRSVGP